MEIQQPQVPQQPAYDAEKMAMMSRMSELMNMTRRMKNGAGTFYWIAGLSVINSLVSVFGGGMVFVIGLGATMFIDAIALLLAKDVGGSSSIVLGMGFLFSLVFDIIFVAFGYFAGKGHRWAFITGMVLYGLDALLMLSFKEWIGFAFHLYFLWGIWQGFQALGKLKALQGNLLGVQPAETMR